jgi:hypothetical protein
MHFKHPEILWLLFLLAIPVIVHLFQLRRFKKEFFTNVAFLQQLSIQTRKSSKLKKYLLLACRCLLLAALVIAFAQPFFPAANEKSASNELYIVVDNSFSMQARGQHGELLRRQVEDLLEHMPENRHFSLLTNDDSFWDTDIRSIRKDLQNLSYSATAFSPEAAAAKINARPSAAGKDVVVLTDGIGFNAARLKSIDALHPDFVIAEAQQKRNISIDTVILAQARDAFYDLEVKLSAYGDFPDAIPVALYDRGKLVAKTLVSPSEKTKAVRFTIPKGNFQGYASVEDNSLPYDNALYFSLNSPGKINVLAIGDDDKNAFLQKIYTPGEFEFQSAALSSLDYNLIGRQDAVVVDELPDIPQALQATLRDFVSKGGNLIVIPGAQTPATQLSAMASAFGKAGFGALRNGKKRIDHIVFNHPLYAGVFEKKVDNFQYPEVSASFPMSGNAAPALSFDDGSPFLSVFAQPVSTVYFFSAPLSRENGNFKQSPLIVPTFYNMAQRTGRSGITALTIGERKPLIVDATLGKDQILSVRNGKSDFVPNQQALGGKVRLTFAENPKQAGNYALFDGSQALRGISFNYARTESDLAQKADLSGQKTFAGVDGVLDDMLTGRSDSLAWKWFAIAALLLALAEILIQKFVS